MPTKEIDRKNKTFVNYSFAELLMIGFIKRFMNIVDVKVTILKD
jgi:hypothetical protein